MKNVRALIKAIRDTKQALIDLNARYHCGDAGLTEYIEKRNQMRSLLHGCEQQFIAECIRVFEVWEKENREVA